MKKIIMGLLIISLMLPVVGCGNKENNKSENDSNETTIENTTNEVKYNTKVCTTDNDMLAKKISVTIQYNDNNEITKITKILETDDSETINNFVNTFEKSFKNINGVKSSFSNKKWTQEFDFDTLTIDNYKKGNNSYMNELFSLSENEIDYSYIKNNKIIIDDYISSELEDYNCK